MDLQTLMEACGKKQCPRFDERKKRLQTLDWIRTRRWPKELGLVDFDERTKGAGSMKRWRPFAERRPAARYDIHAILTRDVIAMLAGDGRFPIISFLDPEVTKTYAEVTSKVGLQAMLNQAATLASIGSVVIVPEVIVPEDVEDDLDDDDDDVSPPVAGANPWLSWTFWLAFECDPVFRRDRPNVLKNVTRTWNVSRSQLQADGYDVAALDRKSAAILSQSDPVASGRRPIRKQPQAGEQQFDSWYRRIKLDQEKTVAYEPVARDVYHRKDWDAWTVDADRSTEHDLGFCPAFWYTTFDDPYSRPDGACIFESAVDNAIQIDRVLSVAAGAVVAAGTPQLAIVRKNMGPGGDALAGEGQHVTEPEPAPIDPDTVLQVDERGGAWLVQLEGGLTPLDVVISRLRSISLENVGGSRLSEEHAAGAKSGYAMELLNQALTYVSGLMRPGFERAAIDAVRMVAMMCEEFGDIDCDGGTLKKSELAGLIDAELKSISYGPNYELSGQDKQFEVTAIVAAATAGLISQETAVAQIAQLFDVTDIEDEIRRVKQDAAKKADQEQVVADADHKRNLEVVKTKGAVSAPVGGNGS